MGGERESFGAGWREVVGLAGVVSGLAAFRALKEQTRPCDVRARVGSSGPRPTQRDQREQRDPRRAPLSTEALAMMGTRAQGRLISGGRRRRRLLEGCVSMYAIAADWLGGPSAAEPRGMRGLRMLRMLQNQAYLSLAPSLARPRTVLGLPWAAPQAGVKSIFC